MPVQQDLTAYWKKCERAIDGLSTEFGVEDLGAAQIKILGPLILGGNAWEVMKDQHFMDWSSFKSVVNQNFGLTTK